MKKRNSRGLTIITAEGERDEKSLGELFSGYPNPGVAITFPKDFVLSEFRKKRVVICGVTPRKGNSLKVVDISFVSNY